VNPRNFEDSTKYGKAGRSDGVIVGRVRLASSRSLGSNCRSPKFWVQDVYPEHGAPEFDSAYPRTRVHKIG
jgi:hypothetical protein